MIRTQRRQRPSGRTLIGRRTLCSALGVLWLLDAGLQLQPAMLSRRFSAEVLGVYTMGPPNLLSELIHAVAIRVAAHPVVWDTTFAVVQILIGVGLLSRRFENAALASSAAWGLMVWVIGEGLGGMLIPQASILTGAPGSALLYCAVSLMLLPRSAAVREPFTATITARYATADTGLPGRLGSRILWAAAWIGPSLLELERANFAPHAISAQISANASGEPWPIAQMDHLLATMTAGNGTTISFVVLSLGLLTGIWVLRESTVKAGLVLGMALAAIYWVAGQNFGAVLTGSSTDPNTGPAFILMALCLWPRVGTTGEANNASAIATTEPRDGALSDVHLAATNRRCPEPAHVAPDDQGQRRRTQP